MLCGCICGELKMSFVMARLLAKSVIWRGRADSQLVVVAWILAKSVIWKVKWRLTTGCCGPTFGQDCEMKGHVETHSWLLWPDFWPRVWYERSSKKSQLLVMARLLAKSLIWKVKYRLTTCCYGSTVGQECVMKGQVATYNCYKSRGAAEMLMYNYNGQIPKDKNHFSHSHGASQETDTSLAKKEKINNYHYVGACQVLQFPLRFHWVTAVHYDFCWTYSMDTPCGELTSLLGNVCVVYPSQISLPITH